MESGHLPDSAISASTYYSADHIPQFSRLNKIPASGKAGAWCTRTNNGNEWLQVYFGRETTVTKVATQGRYDGDNRVTSYSLSYSADGSHWAWYRLADGHIKVLNTINLGWGHLDFFKEHKDTGVSNKMPFLFFYCGCFIVLFVIPFWSTTSREGEKYKSPLSSRKWTSIIFEPT